MESTGSLVLIIDDELDLLVAVTALLEREGFRVVTADNGVSGLEVFRRHSPDLVILDIMMPGLSGWEVLHRLRQISTVPIIVLTVLGQEDDVVRGLQDGADDYVPKPFSVHELLGRVRALLRRVQAAAEKERTEQVTVGDLVLIPESHQIVWRDQCIRLTPTEFRLLSALVRHAGAVVPHRQLLQGVWGREHRADRGQLKVYIHHLRQKLGDDPSHPRYIVSERGEGYRIVI